MSELHLRVLSYNIHKGFNSGRRFTLEGMREAIELVNADMVLLQEVVGAHSGHKEKIENWPTVSQFEFLADRLWPHFAYGQNAVYTEGHHGNAVLSRYPVKFWENINVSTNRYEKRGLLHVVVEVPNSEAPKTSKPLAQIHLICLHLNLLHGGRVKQLEALMRRIHSLVPDGAPLIIGGDFNDWRQAVSSPLKTELKVEEAFEVRHGSHARTFPVGFPLVSLDRIYFRGLRIHEAQCLTGSPWNRLSDHAALFADIIIDI